MAPKAGFRYMQADDQATVLRERAKKIQQKKTRKVINQILDKNVDLMSEVKQLLEGAGYDFSATSRESPLKKEPAAKNVKKECDDDDDDEDDDASDDQHDQTPAKTPKVERKGSAEDADLDEKEGGASAPETNSRVRTACGIADPDSSNWVPHRYTRLETSSVPFLVDLLTKIEPVAYARAALKVLTFRGKKEQKIAALLECLEYATALDRSFSLTGSARHTLASMLIKQRDLEHRRARDLQVPGRWGARGDGFFQFAERDGKIFICDKASGAEHEIPSDDLLRYKSGAVIQAAELEIEHNFSVSKATVVSKHTPETIHILSIGSFGRKGKRPAMVLEPVAEPLNEKLSPPKAEPVVTPVKAAACAPSKAAEPSPKRRRLTGKTAPAPMVISEHLWAPPPPADGMAHPVGVPTAAEAEAALAVQSDDEMEDSSFSEALAQAFGGVKQEHDDHPTGPEADNTLAAFE